MHIVYSDTGFLNVEKCKVMHYGLRTIIGYMDLLMDQNLKVCVKRRI